MLFSNFSTILWKEHVIFYPNLRDNDDARQIVPDQHVGVNIYSPGLLKLQYYIGTHVPPLTLSLSRVNQLLYLLLDNTCLA